MCIHADFPDLLRNEIGKSCCNVEDLTLLKWMRFIAQISVWLGFHLLDERITTRYFNCPKHSLKSIRTYFYNSPQSPCFCFNMVTDANHTGSISNWLWVRHWLAAQRINFSLLFAEHIRECFRHVLQDKPFCFTNRAYAHTSSGKTSVLQICPPRYSWIQTTDSGTTSKYSQSSAEFGSGAEVIAEK